MFDWISDSLPRFWCHEGQAWQSIIKWSKKATVDDVDNVINVVSKCWGIHQPSKSKGKLHSAFHSDAVTVPGLVLCATILSLYAPGAFLCHQRLLFSTLHCDDITVRITHGWASSKTLHHTCIALAYRFFKTHMYLPIINCISNVTFARPSLRMWHKHRGGSSSID